jgi:hypothetical protein
MWLKIRFSLPRLRDIRRHDRAEEGTAEREVLAEAQALLVGRTAERYAAEGLTVPFWAWLNTLAHCAPEALGTVASGCPLHALMPRTTSFADECARLSPAEALELQRAVLIPAELASLGEEEAASSPEVIMRRVHRHFAQMRLQIRSRQTMPPPQPSARWSTRPSRSLD